MKNILTIDVEDWYHANYQGNQQDVGHQEERVTDSTLRILNLLDKTNNQATFFVLGEVAEKLPDLIREIQARGHEIASHSFCHRLVYTMNPEEFRADTKKSKEIIENIIGARIIGYRAPSWSLCQQKTPWAFEILQELGFSYDSSMFPFKTFLYGDNQTPIFHHKKRNLSF